MAIRGEGKLPLESLLTPTNTAAGALILGSLLVRGPMRWAFAALAGVVVGQRMGAVKTARMFQHRRREASAEREWISDPRPGPDGRLSPDALTQAASEDSFPASDPPSHPTKRGS